LLLEAAQQSARIELAAMELLSSWGLAVVDELAGNDGDAARRCQGLLEHWRRTEERHYSIPALRWAVSLFAARRQEPEARACAYALAQIVAETGAAAARELARLGEAVHRRLGRRAAGSLERGGLTRRELEVLRLVADGQTDREIARTLVLSPRTIEIHVSNCLGKLGSRSRAEAVRRAAELQLVGHLELPQKARTSTAKTP
jgi:DNA-binding CsgD family transcriptional regulator